MSRARGPRQVTPSRGRPPGGHRPGRRRAGRPGRGDLGPVGRHQPRSGSTGAAVIVVGSPGGQGVGVAREGNGRRAREKSWRQGRHRTSAGCPHDAQRPGRRSPTTARATSPTERRIPMRPALRHRRCGTNPSEPPVDDAHIARRLWITARGRAPRHLHRRTATTARHARARDRCCRARRDHARCRPMSGERSRRVGQGQRGPVQREHDRSGHPSLCRGERRNTRGTQPHHGLLAAHLRPEFDRLGQTGRRRSRPRTTPATSSRDAPPSVPTSSATRSPSGLTFTAWTASPASQSALTSRGAAVAGASARLMTRTGFPSLRPPMAVHR